MLRLQLHLIHPTTGGGLQASRPWWRKLHLRLLQPTAKRPTQSTTLHSVTCCCAAASCCPDTHTRARAGTRAHVARTSSLACVLLTTNPRIPFPFPFPVLLPSTLPSRPKQYGVWHVRCYRHFHRQRAPTANAFRCTVDTPRQKSNPILLAVGGPEWWRRFDGERQHLQSNRDDLNASEHDLVQRIAIKCRSGT